MSKYNLINYWDNALALHIVNFYLKHVKNIRSEEATGKLFMEIYDYHQIKYGSKYNAIFNPVKTDNVTVKTIK